MDPSKEALWISYTKTEQRKKSSQNGHSRPVAPRGLLLFLTHGDAQLTLDLEHSFVCMKQCEDCVCMCVCVAGGVCVHACHACTVITIYVNCVSTCGGHSTQYIKKRDTFLCLQGAHDLESAPFTQFSCLYKNLFLNPFRYYLTVSDEIQTWVPLSGQTL